MENNGLTVIDASTNFVNGGSLRILVTHKGNSNLKSKRYEEILSEEQKWKLEELDTNTKYENKIFKDTTFHDIGLAQIII